MKDLFGDYAPAAPDLIIAEARRRLAQRYRRCTTLTTPGAARDTLRMKLGGYDHEVFLVVFLDNQHRIIEFREMFQGTIAGAAVYPREVVKATLRVNSAAVVLAHNHPSGLAQPSEADRTITARLKSALALVDIRVLDHFIVGADEVYSFAEHGLM